MAAITAGDVTAAIIDARALNPREPGAPNYSVVCELTIDPGTTDTYPTGGIPLTNQFDSTHAQFLGLDIRYPIRGIPTVARISDALAPMCPAYFYNGGTTAASQTLVLGVTPKDDGTKSDTFIEYPAEDVTTNTTVTTPIANGDKDIKVTLVLYGTQKV
jgi:hypothetical protein